MHNAAYATTSLNFAYLAFDVTDVAACLTGMRALGGFRGLSVTIPHKESVIPFLDTLEPMAAHVGSVNTITNEEGRLVGSTTDGPGALRAFADAGVSLDGRRVLFLGTGGAVRAVAFAVAQMSKPAGITILGRTAAHVDRLVGDVRARTGVEATGGDLALDLEAALGGHDVLIQGTPVGMHPRGGETCVPAPLLRREMVVFDMVYRPHRTQLLQDAEAAGCRVIAGIHMLVNQAALQFERWTGVAAPVARMREAALQALGGQT